MVDQASVSRSNGAQDRATPLGVVSNLADFGNDIATLVELQAKLAVHDAQDTVARATTPLIVLGVGSAMAMASLPVILLGLADLIAENSKLPLGASRLIVGFAALILAGIAAYLGLKGSTSSLESFRRSREELIRNLSWIRTVVVHSGRTAGRRQV